MEVGPRVVCPPNRTLASERVTKAVISGKKAKLPTCGCHGQASMSRATTSAFRACSQRAALRVFLNQGNIASSSNTGLSHAILMLGEVASWVEKKIRKKRRQPARPPALNRMVSNHRATSWRRQSRHVTINVNASTSTATVMGDRYHGVGGLTLPSVLLSMGTVVALTRLVVVLSVVMVAPATASISSMGINIVARWSRTVSTSQPSTKSMPKRAIMCQNVTISDSAVAHCRVAQSLARRHLDDVAGAGRAVVAQEFIAVGAVLGLGVIPQEVSHHDGFVLRQVEFLLNHAAVFHAQHSIGPWNRLAQIVGLSQHETPHESRCLEIEHAIVEIHINRTLLDAYLAVSPDVVRLTARIEGDEAHVHRVLFLQLLCRIGHGQDGSGIKRPCCTQGAQHRHAVCF